MTRVDTNYIVRYLINDNVEMANSAEDVLMNKNVFIANEILAEVVYVLLGVYQISKDEIADQLIELIDFENISTTNHGVAVQALKIFKTKSLDLLCAYSQHDEILTFDKKLTKCVSQK
ncbi:MAG: PIN domain-containing protein [Sulfuricurvum sp.]